jgi:hypothetical protein
MEMKLSIVLDMTEFLLPPVFLLLVYGKVAYYLAEN